MKNLITLSALALLGSVSAQNMMNNAYVRVVHASPDAPAVDVYVDGMKTVSGAPYKAVTPYGDVKAGKHHVIVTASGDMNAKVIEADVDLKAGTYYTVAAVGYLQNIRPKIFTASSLNKNMGKAEINVYHLSPDAPRIQLVAPDMNGAKLLKNGLSFGNAQTLMVNPMGVNLNVTPFGQPGTVVKNLSGIKVAGGKTYSVFAFGLLKGAGDQALAVVPNEDKLVPDSMMGK